MNKCLGILFALVFLTVTAPANMLSNPGFEIGNLDNVSDWVLAGNVGNQSWAPRTGTNGIVFRGWNASPATMSQVVDVTATGTYTFCIWVLHQAAFFTQSNYLQLAWLDSDSNEVTTATTALFEIPNNESWHHVFITGTCTNSNLAKIQVRVGGAWFVTGGDCSFMADDAELYEGPYQGSSLVNGSFEKGTEPRTGGWNIEGKLDPMTNGAMYGRDWAFRNGTRGVSFDSFADYSNNWHTVLYQNVNPKPTTGTFSYLLWLNSETNTLFSNAQMRIEWYDSTFTNKVQDDSVTNFTVPRDWQWYEYGITATSTSPAMHEARLIFTADWSYQASNGANARATKLDDVRFLPGAYDGNCISNDWAYHSGVGMKASLEYVPQTNVGAFLQVDYATTGATVYALADNFTHAKYYPLENDGPFEVRASWQDPGDSMNWTTRWFSMTSIGSINVGTNTEMFHGLPTNGTKKLDVWKGIIPFPLDINGHPYTNISMKYGIFFKITNGVQETDNIFLVGSDGATNNLGQQFDPVIIARDFSFNIDYSRRAALTNGGFETPVANNFDNTGWNGWGLAARDGWAARSGEIGASFHSWNPGDAGVWQDVSSTGGTYTFSVWARQELGCYPNTLHVKLEWYDTAETLIRTDFAIYTDLPRDALWHPLHITSTCTSNYVYYVRPVIAGNFNTPTGYLDTTSISFDDCQVYQGSYTGVPSLANGSFEVRTDDGWRGSQWATWPEIDSISNKAGAKPGYDWVTHSGSRGIWLTSSTNDGTASTTYETTLTQILVPGTGTYTFSIWMKQEPNFSLNEAWMSLQWYDSTITNQVQPDTVTNLTPRIPLTNAWARYDVTGTCTDTNLFEVRLNLHAQWDVYTTPLDMKSMMIDDARFVRGTYPQNLIDIDWAYFNNTDTADPEVEQVPGTNVGAFLDVNYAQTTTTFYVLARHPTFAIHSEETNNVQFRLYYSDGQGNAGEVVTNMTPMGSVVLLDSARFHDLPASGSQTVGLWKVDWRQPLNTNDLLPSTNRFDVWYSPILRTYYNGQMTEERWFVKTNGVWTNSYPIQPQQFGRTFANVDWHYYNQRPPADTNYTDGIPNSWWTRYGISEVNRIGTNNPDSDGADNNEEYVADTSPTDPGSVFLNTITNYLAETNKAYGQGYILRIMAGPPTTNSREYDVYWKTNLKNDAEGWTALQLNVPGDDSGGPVMLIITNNATNQFYRTGVKIPE